MSERTATPLEILATGFRYFRRHPEWPLGIAALAAVLSALGPLLQIKLGLPDDQTTQIALRAVSVLPLELYFVPRFLAHLDADMTDRPENPKGQWQARFEERWLKSFGTRLLLYLACGIGLVPFVIPGLAVLVLFGWAPLRILLRGESIAQAARGSAALMAKAWPQVIRTVLMILALYLMILLGTGLALQRVMPEPTPWKQLTHPLIWVLQAFSGLLEAFFSACFLALYHAVETPNQSSAST